MIIREARLQDANAIAQVHVDAWKTTISISLFPKNGTKSEFHIKSFDTKAIYTKIHLLVLNQQLIC